MIKRPSGQIARQHICTGVIDPNVQSAFDQARSSSQSLNLPLRLRLLIGPSAPELHSLRWETLRDTQDDSPLFTGENLVFSRYLSSLDWRPIRLRPKGDLQALVVIANPSNLSDFNLAPIDIDGELQRAQQGLAIDELAGAYLVGSGPIDFRVNA